VLAYAHALLRRHPLNLLGAGPAILRITPEFVQDLAGQRLLRGTTDIALSNHEFRLLAFLVRHEGAVLTREALMNAVWGFDFDGSSREIDVYVRYVRQKIEPDPAHPRYLLTAWGRGYRYRGLRVAGYVSGRAATAAAGPRADEN
jgi:DNA-binding response OmpR family regulator